MANAFKKIKSIFTEPSIRSRVVFALLIILVFRFLAVIPVPGIDASRLSQALESNQFLNLFNLLSGGGFSTFSIVMLGIGPFITASIIMQLLSMIIPSVKEMMQENGEAGRRKFNQYTRLLTVPVAALQGFSFIKYLQSQQVISILPASSLAANLVIIVAGAVVLMWLGELINEFGIGNGSSIIIMSGIIAAIPTHMSQLLLTYTPDQLPTFILFGALGLLLVAGVVYVYEAERPIGITYAREARGIRSIGTNESYLPLRLTQAGVMPIIFASSLLLFPQFLASMFAVSKSVQLQSIAHSITLFLQSTWQYSIVYFVLVVFFTYFYTAITFDVTKISENLQKNGAFVPGIRPGDATEKYLGSTLSRITFVGSLFLGAIAVLPLIVRATTGISAFAVGGTSLLITVSVVIDLIRRLEAQVALREY
jgi:preprotein translocase subunit SecY